MATLTPAVSPAINNNWLTVDDTYAKGHGTPAAYGYPADGPAPNAVPTAASPAPDTTPEQLTAPSQELLYQSDGWTESWPSLAESGDGRTALSRGDGEPQGVLAYQRPTTHAKGYWGTVEPLQTYDHLSQHVDNEGWDQTVANDRISSRRTFGQDNPANNPTWYGYSENPAQAHLAVHAAEFTVDSRQDGTYSFGDGSLPVQGPGEYSTSGGNIAYETPAQPGAIPITSAAATSIYQSPENNGWS
jgi:hypothetical protein